MVAQSTMFQMNFRFFKSNFRNNVVTGNKILNYKIYFYRRKEKKKKILRRNWDKNWKSIYNNLDFIDFLETD